MVKQLFIGRECMERMKMRREMVASGEIDRDGNLQTIIPGAERVGDGITAQRRADAPLRPTRIQLPPGGLFSDTANQLDLIDAIRSK